jgi:hypothetical protein
VDAVLIERGRIEVGGAASGRQWEGADFFCCRIDANDRI